MTSPLKYSDEIQQAGANARALGIPYLGNPYYMRENMPAATGEEPASWSNKAAAWELGWKMEDARRKGRR